MTRGAMQQLGLDGLSGDSSLRYRDGIEHVAGAAALRRSIQRCGVLQPITVLQREAELVLVAGFRRVALCRELGLTSLPACRTELPADEAFARAVEEHAGQPANLVEVTRALDVARGLGWSEEQSARRLLPSLGLQPHPELVRRHLRLRQLPKALLRLAVDKGFSLKRCLWFCELTSKQLLVVDRLVQQGSVRGGRQLEQATTWLVEVAARDGHGLERVARDSGLLGPGPTAGLERLRQLRFPETSRRVEALSEHAAGIGSPGLRLEFDPTFAAGHLRLVLEVGSPEQLRQHLQRLQDPGLQQRLELALRLAGCMAEPE